MTEIIPEVSGTPDVSEHFWSRRLTNTTGMLAAGLIAAVPAGWWMHDRTLKAAVRHESEQAYGKGVHEATEAARQANMTALSLNAAIDMRRFDGSKDLIAARMLQGTIRFYGQNGESDVVIENPLLSPKGVQELDPSDPSSIWILVQANSADGSPFFYPLFVGRDLDRSMDLDPLQPVRDVALASCAQDIEPEGSITRVCVVDGKGRPTSLPVPGLVTEAQTE
jgi:hypothetical protein